MKIKENSVMNGFQNIKDTLEKSQFIKAKSTEIGFDTNSSFKNLILIYAGSLMNR